MATEMVHLFESHGCQIQWKPCHVELTLPAGTTRKEILPRLQLARFWLTLPDGWQIHEILDWNEESLLSIPVSGRAEE